MRPWWKLYAPDGYKPRSTSSPLAGENAGSRCADVTPSDLLGLPGLADIGAEQMLYHREVRATSAAVNSRPELHQASGPVPREEFWPGSDGLVGLPGTLPCTLRAHQDL